MDSAAKSLHRLNMTQIEERIGEGGSGERGEASAETVPELQKLINQLKMGNLHGVELEELQSQVGLFENRKIKNVKAGRECGSWGTPGEYGAPLNDCTPRG